MSNICIVVTLMCIIGFDVFTCVMYEFIGNISNEIYICQSFGLFWVGGKRYTFDCAWVYDQLFLFVYILNLP